MLRVCLDDGEVIQLLFLAAQDFRYGKRTRRSMPGTVRPGGGASVFSISVRLVHTGRRWIVWGPDCLPRELQSGQCCPSMAWERTTVCSGVPCLASCLKRRVTVAFNPSCGWCIPSRPGTTEKMRTFASMREASNWIPWCPSSSAWRFTALLSRFGRSFCP